MQAYCYFTCWPKYAHFYRRYRRRHHHHHHLANVELGHLLTRSGLTCVEVSLVVFPGFFCKFLDMLK